MKNLKEIKNRRIKANNGNVGTYYAWQSTASGIRIWLEDEKGHTVGSIMLKDIEKFED